jgi:sugar O-acyltransferase (sialic acid O-acetyltransferase NeuD family)
MNGLILWGAGGHGKVVLDCAAACGDFAPIAFIDDNPQLRSFCGCEVIGSSDQLAFTPTRGFGRFLIAIGNNAVRAACFGKALAHGLEPAAAIHPAAVVSRRATIGAGTVVMPRAVVNAGAGIGRNCIINTAAVVEHDCQIGDHVHISPGALLGGGVRVHSYAHVGIGAVALPGAEIGEGAIVGAGAVVLSSVPPGATVVGVPARIIAQRNSIS